MPATAVPSCIRRRVEPAPRSSAASGFRLRTPSGSRSHHGRCLPGEAACSSCPRPGSAGRRIRRRLPTGWRRRRNRRRSPTCVGVSRGREPFQLTPARIQRRLAVRRVVADVLVEELLGHARALEARVVAFAVIRPLARIVSELALGKRAVVVCVSGSAHSMVPLANSPSQSVASCILSSSQELLGHAAALEARVIALAVVRPLAGIVAELHAEAANRPARAGGSGRPRTRCGSPWRRGRHPLRAAASRSCPCR